MPKRRGFIIERIADMENLEKADMEAQAGKARKNRFIRRHNERRAEDLEDLRRMILDLDFPNPEFSTMTVRSDAGKTRVIVKQRYFPWCILQRAIMRVIGDDLNRSLIYDTSACIKGKGLHFGVRRMKMFLRRHPEYRWFVKTDFKKFYQSIPHEVLAKSLERKFKDKRFMRLIEIAIFSYDCEKEMIKILEYEELRKKRCADWSLCEPALGELRGKPGRP